MTVAAALTTRLACSGRRDYWGGKNKRLANGGKKVVYVLGGKNKRLDSGVGMCECLIYDDNYRTVNGCVPRVHIQSTCRTVDKTDHV